VGVGEKKKKIATDGNQIVNKRKIAKSKNIEE
jgi:hypothetical protein